jgi:hypothetical protein
MAALMKFAFLMGKAPADFASMASKLYPIVVSTGLVRPFGLTANQFIFLLAVFEMIAAVAFFFNNRVGAIMVVVVMLGAEYIGFTQAGNSAMPANPMCDNKAACMGSHIFHGVLVWMAVMSYMSAKPICSAWGMACKGWGMFKKGSSAAPQTPSRPKRAAAMKKKDN